MKKVADVILSDVKTTTTNDGGKVYSLIAGLAGDKDILNPKQWTMTHSWSSDSTKLGKERDEWKACALRNRRIIDSLLELADAKADLEAAKKRIAGFEAAEADRIKSAVLMASSLAADNAPNKTEPAKPVRRPRKRGER